MRKYQDPNKAARNRKRLNLHRYGKARRQWEDEDILRFLELNTRGADGRYLVADHEIARQLESTLASVQYLRRKANILHRKKVPSEKFLEMMRHSEDTLRKM